LKLVDETPGTAALFLRLTPDGVKAYVSSRFKDVPRVRSPEAEKRAG
jgi:hypothetical protein